MDFTIQREKLDQAVRILKEQEVDMWLTFVRETATNPDPALDLILGIEVTWPSVFILTRDNQRIAIVGRYDVENIQLMGAFSEVIGYDEDITPHLRLIIERLNPQWIAINYSENDPLADGLSYGMWISLNIILGDTAYRHRLVSAEKILWALRGRKSQTEIRRIRNAVQSTETIIQQISAYLKVGLTATEIADFVQAEMAQHGLQPAWSPCPMVTPGPDAPIGHATPTDKHQTAAGQLLHIDLGVRQEGYTSDLQRVWYLQATEENELPEVLQRGFQFVRAALLAAAQTLKPGVPGWEVDAASRKMFQDYNYPEYQHAVGHQLGRSVHDGGTLLGPRWAKYGKSVEGLVEVGNVFTLELGLQIPSYGLISLEEDVLVTESGVEWLSTPQSELIVLKV